ncbi:MAG: septum site-determining protein MinD [Clostridia bacterium]|nr:septum site-determining protein MinD [Clostridia bacterium]
MGKTTICASLGTALAKLGARVALVDADITLNNLDLTLGLETSVVYDISDVVSGKCRLKQALLQDPYAEGLFVLPSSHAMRSGGIAAKDFKEIILTLRENFDYVLIDCPAGVDEGFHRAVSASSEALIVTTPSISALRDADKVITLLDSYKMQNIALVVNRVRGDLVLEGEMLSVADIVKLLHIKIISCIPEDDKALMMCGSTPALSLHNQAIVMLAHNIECGTARIFDATAKYRGIVGKIRRKLIKI